MVYRRSQKHVAHAHRKTLLVFLTVIVVLGGVITALWATHTFPFHKKAEPITIRTANSTTKGEPLPTGNDTTGQPAPSEDSNWPSDNKSPTGNTSNAPTPSGQKPVISDGNFVSNHKARLNDVEQSSCITNAGATCQILFTKDGVTKSLEAKKTDVGGGAYWNSWTPASIGLTAGTWKVQAKATLGSQTTTSDDAIPLEVSP